MNLDKLATDVVHRIKEKMTNKDEEEQRPSIFSPQMMKETGMDAAEIALRNLARSI